MQWAADAATEDGMKELWAAQRDEMGMWIREQIKLIDLALLDA